MNGKESKIVFENSSIELSLLKPDSSSEEVINLCNEAVLRKFSTICVPPYFLQLVKKTVKKSNIKIATVIGFPFGFNTVSSKVEEAKKAILSGADEINMVINITAFKNKDFNTVQNDISSVVTACHLHNATLTIIIEASFWSDEEIAKACKLAADCEANYVKCSTGFGPAIVTIEQINEIRKALPKKVGVIVSISAKNKKNIPKLPDVGITKISIDNLSILD